MEDYMKKILEDLWYSYLMENSIERNTEKKKILNILTANEEKLHEKLNKEQKEALENYENSLYEINSISEKEAFIKGIRFATMFLIEALCLDDTIRVQ